MVLVDGGFYKQVTPSGVNRNLCSAAQLGLERFMHLNPVLRPMLYFGASYPKYSYNSARVCINPSTFFCVPRSRNAQ